MPRSPPSQNVLDWLGKLISGLRLNGVPGAAENQGLSGRVEGVGRSRYLSALCSHQGGIHGQHISQQSGSRRDPAS
jgi:hypothetical protein